MIKRIKKEMKCSKVIDQYLKKKNLGKETQSNFEVKSVIIEIGV